MDLARIAPEDRDSAYVTFYDVLNGLMKLPNVDIYVTGSNSDEPHLMENAVCNELLARGYSIDVGMVETIETVRGKREKKQREIDFVVNSGTKRVYIQSAFRIDTEEKLEQESASLRKSGDFFRKLIVTSGFARPTEDKDGIVTVGIIPFLLDPTILSI